MSEDNTSLEEVVVVGYGVQKRRDIVGAVETLSTKGLEERMGSSMSISRSLQGAIPGLTMTFPTVSPTAARRCASAARRTRSVRAVRPW